MPITPNTDSSEVVANYVYQKLQDPTNMSNLGYTDVWYGDQELLPHTPALCVSPGTKKREFQGASYRTLNSIETYIVVYYGKIQDVQVNLHAAQTMADALETLIHSDLTLGGLVIATLCTQNEPGYLRKGTDLMQGNRLTFESMSKTTFPQQVV
jgi:hypothetical protein